MRKQANPVDELPGATPGEGVEAAGEEVAEVDVVDDEVVDGLHVLLLQGGVELLTATGVAEGGGRGDEGEVGGAESALALAALAGHHLEGRGKKGKQQGEGEW